MSKLMTELAKLKAGKTSPENVASLIKPGKKPVQQDLLRADAEDPDTSVEPESFDEVSVAYMKGEITDEQYGAIVAAVGKSGSGASGSSK